MATIVPQPLGRNSLVPSARNHNWPRRDLNPHGDCSPSDFKSDASAGFATRPLASCYLRGDTLSLPIGGRNSKLTRRKWLDFAEYCKIPERAAKTNLSAQIEAREPRRGWEYTLGGYQVLKEVAQRPRGRAVGPATDCR